MLAWTIISVKSCAKCSRASPAACELQFVSESDHKYKYTLIADMNSRRREKYPLFCLIYYMTVIANKAKDI